jgi:hypothetical protein
MSTNYGTDIEILVRSVKWLHKYFKTILSHTSYVVTWTEQSSTKAASDLVCWLPACHRGGSGSIRSQSTGELWGTKWAHLYTEAGLYLSALLRQVSTRIYIYIYIYLFIHPIRYLTLTATSNNTSKCKTKSYSLNPYSRLARFKNVPSLIVTVPSHFTFFIDIRKIMSVCTIKIFRCVMSVTV